MGRYFPGFVTSRSVLTSLTWLVLAYVLSACTVTVPGGGGGGGPAQKPIPPYCPYLPSKTFSSPITVTGAAYYEFRSNGNGPVSDSVHTITPTSTLASTNYSITINGTVVNASCPVACTSTAAVTALKTAVGANSSLPVTASGTTTMILTPKNEGDAITISGLSNLADTAESYTSPNNITHADPNPIRYAEVQVTDSAGTIIQCGETDASGAFSFQLPQGGATYTVSVLSRSNNSSNTAYVLDTPYENTPHKVSGNIAASSSTSVRLVAKATGTIVGGAFNILDQIYKAQSYMRTQTLNCNVNGQANYFADCTPFSVAPVINVYWSAGITPAAYESPPDNRAISYYGSPNGSASMKGLYILGGIDGDTTYSDMDHFDNSVIVHEYGHYIEDTYGKMDSPGGSHNGDSIIDPRLAWGEGWADFFQGAVLDQYGTGQYRDTYGVVGCSGASCYGAGFTESLSANPNTCGTGCKDKPTASGEGNFREFSIARILYKASVNFPGGTVPSRFSEIWTALSGGSQGMKASSDRFKGIGRFHLIERATSNDALWSAVRSTESHYGDVVDYVNTFSTSGCASTSQAMAIRVLSADNGSFSTSDQFRNNDFYYWSWSGGQATFALNWSGASVADLNLYIYPEGYVFGDPLTSSATSSNTSSGSESITASLAAGKYVINVKANTGRTSSAYVGPYTATGTYNTTYNLTVNGSPVCPTLSNKDPARP